MKLTGYQKLLLPSRLLWLVRARWWWLTNPCLVGYQTFFGWHWLHPRPQRKTWTFFLMKLIVWVTILMSKLLLLEHKEIRCLFLWCMYKSIIILFCHKYIMHPIVWYMKFNSHRLVCACTYSKKNRVQLHCRVAVYPKLLAMEGQALCYTSQDHRLLHMKCCIVSAGLLYLPRAWVNL